MTTINDLDDFRALEPFFRIIEQGLDGLVDGDHFFDLLAEDVVFDYIITTPGYPRHVQGRRAVAELYRPYGEMIVLDRCHDLAVHHDPNTRVVVLEYASQGRVVATGTPYANRYISVPQSPIARSVAGATTSTLWRSSMLSGGPRISRCREPDRPPAVTSFSSTDPASAAPACIQIAATISPWRVAHPLRAGRRTRRRRPSPADASGWRRRLIGHPQRAPDEVRVCLAPHLSEPGSCLVWINGFCRA